MNRSIYTIVWLTRKVREKANQQSILTNYFVTETNQGETVQKYPHKLIFLNPHYVDEHTPQGVADWMNLILESFNNPTNPELNFDREIFHKATDIISEDGLNATEMAEIIDEHAYERKLQKNWAEGVEKGLEQGIEKGIELGQIQVLHRLLLLQLAQKFTDIPSHVLAEIEQTDDAAQLERWLLQLATASDWRELFT